MTAFLQAKVVRGNISSIGLENAAPLTPESARCGAQSPRVLRSKCPHVTAQAPYTAASHHTFTDREIQRSDPWSHCVPRILCDPALLCAETALPQSLSRSGHRFSRGVLLPPAPHTGVHLQQVCVTSVGNSLVLHRVYESYAVRLTRASADRSIIIYSQYYSYSPDGKRFFFFFCIFILPAFPRVIDCFRSYIVLFSSHGNLLHFSLQTDTFLQF